MGESLTRALRGREKKAIPAVSLHYFSSFDSD